MQSEDRDLISRVGPVEVDWPRAGGYYAGVVLAVTFGLIEPPLGLFIASVPILKMLNRPNSPLPARILSQALDGASKPVGGDGESSVRLAESRNSRSGSGAFGGFGRRIQQEIGSVVAEARIMANGA